MCWLKCFFFNFSVFICSFKWGMCLNSVWQSKNHETQKNVEQFAGKSRFYGPKWRHFNWFHATFKRAANVRLSKHQAFNVLAVARIIFLSLILFINSFFLLFQLSIWCASIQHTYSLHKSMIIIDFLGLINVPTTNCSRHCFESNEEKSIYDDRTLSLSVCIDYISTDDWKCSILHKCLFMLWPEPNKFSHFMRTRLIENQSNQTLFATGIDIGNYLLFAFIARMCVAFAVVWFSHYFHR